MTSLEFRDSGLIEVKFAAEGDGAGTFVGYASVFGGPPDSYGDVIRKGAYRETLAEAKHTGNWPPMLLNHGGFIGGADDLTPIGLWTSIEEDDRGLAVEGKLADTARGREIATLLRMKPRPALSGLSIGFKAIGFEMGSKPGEPRRTLTKIALHEISVVTAPAQARARITGVKAEERFHPKSLERLLRDAGYSRREASAIVAGGLKSAAGLRDADEGAERELADAAEAAMASLHSLTRSFAR